MLVSAISPKNLSILSALLLSALMVFTATVVPSQMLLQRLIMMRFSTRVEVEVEVESVIRENKDMRQHIHARLDFTAAFSRARSPTHMHLLLAHLKTSPKLPSPTFSSSLISFHLISHSYCFSSFGVNCLCSRPEIDSLLENLLEFEDVREMLCTWSLRAVSSLDENSRSLSSVPATRRPWSRMRGVMRLRGSERIRDTFDDTRCRAHEV